MRREKKEKKRGDWEYIHCHGFYDKASLFCKNCKNHISPFFLNKKKSFSSGDVIQHSMNFENAIQEMFSFKEGSGVMISRLLGKLRDQPGVTLRKGCGVESIAENGTFTLNLVRQSWCSFAKLLSHFLLSFKRYTLGFSSTADNG